MAEIQGLPLDDPSSNSSNPQYNSVLTGALGTIFSNMIDYLHRIDNNLEKIVTKDTLSNTSKKTSQVSSSSVFTNSSINKNTEALQTLTSTILKSSVNVNISISKGNYLEKLLKLTNKQTALEALGKISDVFANSVEKIARLDRYTGNIDKVSASLLGFFGSFSRLGKGFVVVSAGIALLGLSLSTFMEAVTVDDLLTFAGIILTLRLASEVAEGAAKDFALLSVGIGLMGLAVYAFSEFLDADMTLGFIAKVGAIGLTVAGLSKTYSWIGKSTPLIMRGTLAVAAMTGSLWALGKVLGKIPEVDILNMGKLALTIGVLGKAYSFIGKSAVMVMKGSLAVAAVGASLWVIAWGLNALSTIEISGSKALEMIGAFGAAVTLVGLVGASGPIALAIGAGSLAVAAVGASLWTLAWGLNALTTIKVTKGQAETFKESSINVIKALGQLGLYSPLLAVAVTASTALALATTATVGALWMVAKTKEINNETFDNFKYGLDRMLDAFTVLGQWGTIAVMGAVPVTGSLLLATTATVGAMNMVTRMPNVEREKYDNFKYGLSKMIDVYSVLGFKSSLKILGSVPVTGAMLLSTLSLRGTMWTISKMKILGPQHYDNFKYAINKLVEIYKGVGFWGAAKATASAGVITIIANASLATALAIRSFTAISKDPAAIENAVSGIDKFVTGFVNAFELNKDKLDSVKPGIKAFYGIGRMGKGIADTVRALGKMEFSDDTVGPDGKIIKGKTTKITSKDLAAVGTGLGMIISALTEPLSNVGSQKETFKIGGFTITNPFSNKVKNGVSAMAKIGNVIMPIIEAVKLFTSPENKIDKTFVKDFGWNFSYLMSSIGASFKTADTSLGQLEFKNMTQAAATIEILTRAISKDKFSSGATVFTGFTSDLAKIKTHLNGMDLDKLTKFNSMMSNLVELQKSKGMEELVKAFKEFIETFISFTEVREQEIQAAEQRNKELEEIRKLQSQNVGSGVLQPAFSQPSFTQPAQTVQPTQNQASQSDVVAAINKLISLFNSTEGAKVKVTNGLQPYFNQM